jgi:hypothetical protein
MEELEREEFSRIFPQNWDFSRFFKESNSEVRWSRLVLRVYEPKKTGAQRTRSKPTSTSLCWFDSTA